MLEIGDELPDLELNNQDGESVKMREISGEKLIVYFYPKDNTPGCTKEAVNFRDAIEDYKSEDISIIGISADSVTSHKRFAEKYDLNFELLADPDKKAAKAFGALVSGKVKRRTWVFDKARKVEKTYKTVSPTKHNDELCVYLGLKPPQKD